VTLEQRGADFGLQRLDALRDVGLHRIEHVGSTGDAAGARHGRKRRQIVQLHRSGPFQFCDGRVLK